MCVEASEGLTSPGKPAVPRWEGFFYAMGGGAFYSTAFTYLLTWLGSEPKHPQKEPNMAHGVSHQNTHLQYSIRALQSSLLQLGVHLMLRPPGSSDGCYYSAVVIVSGVWPRSMQKPPPHLRGHFNSC